MSWSRIDALPPPVGRPVLVRTADDDEPAVAFLGADGVWYEGAALVQSATNLLVAEPTEWCEPKGDDSL